MAFLDPTKGTRNEDISAKTIGIDFISFIYVLLCHIGVLSYYPYW